MDDAQRPKGSGLLGRHGLASDAAVEVMNEVLANVVGEAVA